MIGRRRPRPATDVPPVVVAPPPGPPDGVAVPHLLRFVAAWSWRLLVVVAAIYVLLRLFALLSVVLVPVIVALLLSAVASPIVDRLQRWLPRSVATALVV